MMDEPNPLQAVAIAILMCLVAEAAIRKERSLFIRLIRAIGG